MTRDEIISESLYITLDPTNNFFEEGICNSKFKSILRYITRVVDFPELRRIYGRLTTPSTKWNITMPVGNTVRYTYVSGWQPYSDLLSQNDSVKIYLPGGNTNNSLDSVTVTGVGASNGKLSYFEVTNASGVIESNILTGSNGYIIKTDIITVSGQKDYNMPVFQKIQGNCITVGTEEYELVEENQIPRHSEQERPACYISDGRLFFTKDLGNGSIITIPYYKYHTDVISNKQVLDFADSEPFNALMYGMEYKFMELDNSISSNEAQLKKKEYLDEVDALANYYKNGRLKGRSIQYNGSSNNLFSSR